MMLGNAEQELQAFLAKSDIPVASTLLGLSAVPTSSPQYVGMLGMHGNYGPNIRNQECDLLIAVGMRFDDRVTGNPKCFGANAKVIHLEIDPAEIDKIVHADVAVIGDVKQTLPLLTQRILSAGPVSYTHRRSAPRPQAVRRPSAAATGNSRRNNRMPAVSSAAG